MTMGEQPPSSSASPPPVVNTPRSLPPGDPFGLLKPYQTARPLDDWDIKYRFTQLRILLTRCYKKRLTNRINGVKEFGGPKKCNLCKDNLPTPISVLDHCLSDKHVDAMNGAVCANAFMFWWRLVQEFTIAERKPIVMTPAPREPNPFIAPAPGVDPLALLKSCEGARRKMKANKIAMNFAELLARFNLCDPKLMMKQTAVVFDGKKFKECSFCKEDVVFSTMIEHICTPKHIKAMNGAVCADAFDFWWSVVEAAIPDDRLKTLPFVPESARWPRPVPVPKTPQISQPPNVDPFALFQSCHTRFPLMTKWAINGSFNALRDRFNRCDKKSLAKQTSSLFEKLRSSRTKGCILCKKYVTSIDDMIIHICDPTHIDKMQGDVCSDAFNFWWRAVESVTDLDSEPANDWNWNWRPVIQMRLAAIPQITPLPHVDPFALLGSCSKRLPLMDKSTIDFRFDALRMRFDECDKKRLMQQTSSLFEKRRLSGVKACALCNTNVAKIGGMIIHICDQAHIKKMNGMVDLYAFNFWWEAVTSVPEPEKPPIDKKSDPVVMQLPASGKKPEPATQKKPAKGKKPKPATQKNPANGKKPEPAIQKKPANGKKPDPVIQKKPESAAQKKPKPVKQPAIDKEAQFERVKLLKMPAFIDKRTAPKYSSLSSMLDD